MRWTGISELDSWTEDLYLLFLDVWTCLLRPSDSRRWEVLQMHPVGGLGVGAVFTRPQLCQICPNPTRGGAHRGLPTQRKGKAEKVKFTPKPHRPTSDGGGSLRFTREKKDVAVKGSGGSWDFHFVEWWAGLLFPMSKQFGGSVYHRVRIQAVLRHLWTFINLPAHELHTGQRQRTSEVRGHVSASHHDSIYGILSSSSSESTGDQRTAEPRADERCNMNMNPLSRKSWRQRWSENIHLVVSEVFC